MKTKFGIILSIVLLLVLSACGPASPKERKSEEKNGNQKIASLSIHLTNDLLALGITPAGSVVGGGLKDFLPHVKDQLKNTKKLGPAADPDMEALLALKPSAIYMDEEYGGKDLGKFKKIAPVHVFDLDEGTWRDHLKKIGKLVNRDKQAKEFVEDYDKETKEVKGLIQHELGKNSKAMAIRVTAKELRVFGTARPMGPILFDDLGFTPANGVKKVDANQPYQVISQEVLPDFDADAIFVVVNQDDQSKTAFKQMENSSIWKGLKAVKNKHVYVVPDQPWLDYSALGNKMAMDQAEKMFSK
ncbi:ABC transporter substrate-binding protein [Fictibacillus fluitans]|uniref:ABC transporter substrate-binding protein n=1 Tax=Fictibacillus fluitans TaxID=3058422 RepID=A0ABT8I2I0_9BACL|nr:ABC transporter substrate-binding protein [Fictibacillus sp. NE201]MDN4527233.1 ABC transporter substrate-binding protein [Fictibacillus sp. NE201]